VGLAAAYVVPWVVVLAAISLFGTLLVLLELPWTLVVNVVWVADSLWVLSIVVVPLVLFLHARLCRRGRFSFMPYLGIGASVPSIAILVVVLFGIALRPTYWLIPAYVPSLPVLPVLVAAVIGVVVSAIEWHFAIRPLRPREMKVAGIFD
jgi:hypothetical protein